MSIHSISRYTSAHAADSSTASPAAHSRRRNRTPSRARSASIAAVLAASTMAAGTATAAAAPTGAAEGAPAITSPLADLPDGVPGDLPGGLPGSAVPGAQGDLPGSAVADPIIPEGSGSSTGGIIPQAPNTNGDIVYEAGHSPVPETGHMATSADGTPISYFEYGQPKESAPTIVLVHGYPNTHAVFYGLLPHLVDKYHVISIDTRGSGDSGHPDAIEAYTIDRLNEDYLAVVNQAVPGKKVTYVGHDFGGIIGWDLLRHPETRATIGRYITFGSPSFEQWAQWTRERLDPTDQPFGVLDFANQMIRIPEFWSFLVPGVPEASWSAGTFDAAVSYLNTLSDEPRESGYSNADGLAQARAYQANFGDRIMNPRYSRIEDTPPLLSLSGTRDRFFTRDFIHCIDAQQPEVVHWTYDAGHWGIMVIPDQIAGQIDRFISTTQEG